MHRMTGGVLEPLVAPEDLGDAAFSIAALKLAYILIFDWLFGRGLIVTPYLAEQYREWCEDRDEALAELKIDNPFAVTEN
jgi:hypothetical protein